MSTTFDPDLIHAIFKLIWSKKALERQRNENTETAVGEIPGSTSTLAVTAIISTYRLCLMVSAGTSKKYRPTSANANALKLSCELLRVFVTEAVQRAAAIAEAEGSSKIQATHLERILPQLLLDF